MLPRGAYYRYLNTGDRNLFLLRIGARDHSVDATGETRMKPDGTPIPPYTTENHHVEGVEIPGKFFGSK